MAATVGGAEPALTGPVADRLAALEAHVAIRHLKHRYWRACDDKDPVAMRACFVASGADIDFGPLGRFADADALVAVYERIALQRLDDGSFRILDAHRGRHEEVVLTSPTTATGRWRLRFQQLDRTRRTQRVAEVDYDDGYRFEDGGWRIARSIARERWSVLTQLPEDAAIEEHLGG